MSAIHRPVQYFSCAFLGLAVLCAALAGVASAAQMFVTADGKPLGEATVRIETIRGEALAAGKTDGQGIAAIGIPENAAGKPAIVRVVRPDGKSIRMGVAQPPGTHWQNLFVDLNRGVSGLTAKAMDGIKEALKPIEVGDNGDVGTGARSKDKVRETVGGMLGSAGGLFGGGGFSLGGGGRDLPSGGGGKDVETKDDPIAKEQKQVFTDAKTGNKIAVGTKFTKDGLLVSADIVESKDDGTFQTVYLIDGGGLIGGPMNYDIYEMYQDWKLTVWWTEDRWVNGKHVSHKEGGWSKEGRNLGTFAVPRKGEGVWKNLGFGNAVKGVKTLGATFPTSPQSLFREGPVHLVVHVTNPGEDTVTTTPFIVAVERDCPCATRVRHSILDETADNMPDDIREIPERLKALNDLRNDLWADKSDYEAFNRATQEELERTRAARDEPDLSEDVLQKMTDDIAGMKARIDLWEKEIAELTVRIAEIDAERQALQQRLNDHQARNTGSSIMDDLGPANAGGCDCGTPALRPAAAHPGVFTNGT